jgi:cytochrome b
MAAVHEELVHKALPTESTKPEVPVWDLLVRLLHWSLVASFAIAWVTAEEVEWLHEALGYCVGGIVGLRVLWGFIGPRHARFSDFLRPPRQAMCYLRSLLRGHARRHIGHNPAGGLMIVTLLAALSVTVVTGIFADDGGAFGHLLEETHEAAAYVTLGLVFTHVAGVIAGSLAHRENLVRAMISGRKRGN